MSIVTTSLAAVAIAASVIVPAGAAFAAPVTAESHQSQSVADAPSIESVDWFKAFDQKVVGVAAPGTATVRISGLTLAPGAYREGTVAADGTFAVNLAPFASRVRPFSMLTATAVAADGTVGASKQFRVELGNKPAVAAAPASVVSQHVVTGLEVDAISAGGAVITGDVPVGTQDVAVDVFGSTVFGTVAADGSFSIELGDYAAYAVVGVTFEVWAVAVDGAIVPSQSVPVTV